MKVLSFIVVLFLVCPPGFAKNESSSSDAASVVLYGNNGGNLVRIKVDADGVVDTSGGVGGGDNATVNGSAVDTTANFADGDIDWTLVDGGAGGPDDVTGTVACSGCVDATDLATDSVSADELNATGVEAELEAALDIAGEGTSTGKADPK